ncbi:MAG: energy-coupling factor transporter transmembrane component T family protein [Eubacteriales bacterium]|nr:energy-coupling factor transporter transmembrane protein EcfT [Clostridiales bacterium]
MLKDITLGQFFPGDSLLHKLDPRVKLILTTAYIILVFIARGAAGFAVILAFTLAMIAISKIPAKIIVRGLKPLLFIIMFTAAINVFWTKGENLLVRFGFIEIYFEGVLHAVLMVLRVVLLLLGSSVLLTYTTSPIALTDGLELLLSPLKKLRVPVHEFAMMMTIALRFIPTLIEETDKIMNAQKARGVDFSSGSIIQRAKALIPILIPLFVSAFRRADELAVAMECRCYRGGEGRTRMKVLKLSHLDFIASAVFVLFCASVVAANIFVPWLSVR